MISDEKKKQIESLSTEEMLYEINLGVKSRFQREKFAYLQTCYKNRIVENEEKDAMTRADYGVPPGKIIVEHEWKLRQSTEIPNVTPDPPPNKAEAKHDWHNKPLGKIAIGTIIVVLGAITIWVNNHYLSVNLQNIK